MGTGKDTFLQTDDRAAWVFSGVVGPFALSDGQTLTVKIDRGDVQNVTLSDTDFANIAAATAIELAYVLDRDLENCRSFVSSGKVVIASSTYGASSYVEVTGGTANTVIQFSTTETQGISNATLQARADPQGLAIDLSWYLWNTNEAASSWNGQFKILVKQGEYPREHDDPNATEVFSTTYSSPFTKDQQTTELSNLSPGVIYYFTVFVYRTDFGAWFYDEEASFAWAFPFGQWGHGEWMLRRSPTKDQRNDTTGDWEAYLSIFGALLDGKKTEIEQLKTFYDIPNVRADLLPYHDQLIGWPTNYELPELDQRNETLNALILWTKKGSAYSITFPLEQVTGYDVQLMDGWKYCMIRNDVACERPDTTDPNIPPNIEEPDDLLKYRPDPGEWKSITGWGVYFSGIAGQSEDFTQVMVNKVSRIMEVMKPTFVDYSLIINPWTAVDEPTEEPAAPTDEYFDQISMLTEEAPESEVEESLAGSITTHTTMMHNQTSSTHNDELDLHPHNDFTYDG